ncbi:mycothiol system anti-sigma-R factor [Brachybacterium sp. UNK5269]|uniref:mycothiol system anti-sigma-R factor n=1 Tax=Brachybacterium sp. UNK5269 TaxID=3408576 RepID=UPI003BB0D006
MSQDDRTAPEATGGTTRRDLRYGLEEALDGELPRELVERMQRHTDECPECAEEWERMRRMKELVRRSCADRAPSELRERIAVQCRSVSITRTEADGTSVHITSTTTYRAP